jgi:hypothetical protein
VERLEGGSGKQKKPLETVLQVLSQVLLPIGIALLGYFLSRGQLALARAQEARMVSEATNQRAMKLLELAYADLASNDESRQLWALSLVSDLDPKIGRAFVRALSQGTSTSPEVRSKAFAVARASERYGPLAAYRLDIFTEEREPIDGEDPPALTPYATQLDTHLFYEGFPGEVRIMWEDPAMVRNHGAPDGNVILYEEPYEREAAESLQRLMTRLDPPTAYHLCAVKQASNGVLSIVLSKTGDPATR